MARPCHAAHVARIIAQASARPAACVGHQIVRPVLPIVGQHVTTARPARDLRLAIERTARDGVALAIALLNTLSSVSVRESRIQYLCDPKLFRDTASHGPTTIVPPKSQFRTCPSDHGKAPSNIAP
ncbi:putative glycerol-3-phosphate acyltransferase 2-like [Dorcoceras hygrometricum]|uniref:Putative glycerol-3-phosphate acyltransferase 2-like n=1 Tax=Dorcoceras hygrometricum TaxID=472368 RepID=A0A2Z7A9Z4_9LAMI|nr:putative glycerol-3-phosphate acyltransferase 2-like [Dorcoceras hygrometricum]